MTFPQESLIRGCDEPGLRRKEAQHYSTSKYRRNGKHHALFPHSNPKPVTSFHSVGELFKGQRLEEKKRELQSADPSLRHLIQTVCVSVFPEHTTTSRRDHGSLGHQNALISTQLSPFTSASTPSRPNSHAQHESSWAGNSNCPPQPPSLL